MLGFILHSEPQQNPVMYPMFFGLETGNIIETRPGAVLMRHAVDAVLFERINWNTSYGVCFGLYAVYGRFPGAFRASIGVIMETIDKIVSWVCCGCFVALWLIIGLTG